MDPRLLEYYNQELQFLREAGAEFAAANPRIAARLGLMGAQECADPYVERLLEGVAFLAARVKLKLEARHPDFTQHLLEIVYPHFLRPVPSCAVVELVPVRNEDALAAGVKVPRGSTLRSVPGKGERTACEFRTAHEVTLWPIEIAEAKYVAGAGALANLGVPVKPGCRGAIRLRLRATSGAAFEAMPIDSLTFYVKAQGDLGARLYEQIAANALGAVVRGGPDGAAAELPAAAVQPVGLADEEALLPDVRGGFHGYRLLQEYFAFPERFMFFRVAGLTSGIRAIRGKEADLFIVLDRVQASLENSVDVSCLRLNCTPIVNLFSRSLDRLHVDGTSTEYHVVPDRNRPMDFEVFSVERVRAVGSGEEGAEEVVPFYSTRHGARPRPYYTIQRRPRLPSSAQAQKGARSSYVGSECFISLVDARQRPLRKLSGQLEIEALCTNRDLPIGLHLGMGKTDLVFEDAAPVESIRCITGPTLPRSSPAFGDTAWRLVSQLSLNYLSLLDAGADGAELLREILTLYADPNDAVMARHIEGIRGVEHEAVVRRIPGHGPACFGRGLAIAVHFDEAAYEGVGILLLGSVLERFFARYVSINSFVQTRVVSQTRGEIKQWPIRIGARHTI